MEGGRRRNDRDPAPDTLVPDVSRGIGIESGTESGPCDRSLEFRSRTEETLAHPDVLLGQALWARGGKGVAGLAEERRQRQQDDNREGRGGDEPKNKGLRVCLLAP